MNKTVILTHKGSQIPGRVINLDQARVRHGDKADHMVRMLAVGDRLVDAVIVEMDALGKEDRRILNAGLTERPPAITALLQQLESCLLGGTRHMLGRGEVASLSVSPLIMLAGDERADTRAGPRAILPALEDLVPGCDDQHWGPVPAPMR